MYKLVLSNANQIMKSYVKQRYPVDKIILSMMYMMKVETFDTITYLIISPQEPHIFLLLLKYNFIMLNKAVIKIITKKSPIFIAMTMMNDCNV